MLAETFRAIRVSFPFSKIGERFEVGGVLRNEADSAAAIVGRSAERTGGDEFRFEAKFREVSCGGGRHGFFDDRHRDWCGQISPKLLSLLECF